MRRDAEAEGAERGVGVCGDTISGAWYAGPTCKMCYERGVRAKNRAKNHGSIGKGTYRYQGLRRADRGCAVT